MNDTTPSRTNRLRPMTLLAVEADGTVAAAWQMDAHRPSQLARHCGTTEDKHAVNPARWVVYDRHTSPSGFWAALQAGEIGARPADGPQTVPASWPEREREFIAPPGDAGARHGVDPARWQDAPVIHPAWAGDGYVRKLTETQGTPPPGLPLADRARWVAQYALIVQAPLMAHPRLRFHGTPGPMPGTGNVAIEFHGGGFLAPLANTGYAKSPSGFGWGGGTLGSGPAALAKSLITAALGRYAVCGGCAGTGRVAWLADPSDPERVYRPWRPEDGAPDAELAVAACPACDHDGIGIPPAVYHEYAAEVVAGLPEEGEWRLTRTDVLAWLETGDGRLADAARSVER